MIELAQAYAGARPVRYVGIDLFESRPPQTPGMTLKCAFVQLKSLGVRLRLIPGDAFSALAQTANELGQFDMVVVRCDQDPTALKHAWFYFPRLVHAGSRVFIEPNESAAGGEFQEFGLQEVLRQSASVVQPAAKVA
jgi:hypothetical protein